MNTDSAADELPLFSFLCFGVALRSLGNHIRGTDTVRPSSSTTVSASSEQATSTASVSLLSTKVGIPFLHEPILIFQYEFSNHSQFVTSKTPVRCQGQGIEPKLRITARMGNVNVRCLAIFQTVEEPVTANPEQHWHGPSLHPLGWRNPLQWGGLRPGIPTIAAWISSHYKAIYDLSCVLPPSS